MALARLISFHGAVPLRRGCTIPRRCPLGGLQQPFRHAAPPIWRIEDMLMKPRNRTMARGAFRKGLALHAICAALLLTGLACRGTTTPPELVPSAIALRGLVVTSSGQPAMNARVRSLVYKVDCTTPIASDRDTLLVTDTAGAFAGFINVAPGNPRGCVRMTATAATGGPSTTQTFQARFETPTPGVPDTLRPRFTLP